MRADPLFLLHPIRVIGNLPLYCTRRGRLERIVQAIVKKVIFVCRKIAAADCWLASSVSSFCKVARCVRRLWILDDLCSTSAKEDLESRRVQSVGVASEVPEAAVIRAQVFGLRSGGRFGLVLGRFLVDLLGGGLA